MYTLYTWSTPNGYKVSIALEELGVPYRVQPIDIGENQQFTPEFLALNPNHKIPVLVDEAAAPAPWVVAESGAILWYLAQKHGRLWPQGLPQQAEAMQWLMFQMAGFGPMLGQLHHFKIFAKERLPYAIERYEREANRLYGVLAQRLAGRNYILDEYSMVDIALYPWASLHEWEGLDLSPYPQVLAWMARVAERPAVQKGMTVPQPRQF